MTDSTDNRTPRHRVRRLAAGLAAAWLVLIAYPAWVRADGDPASDVLATQSLFLPQDAGIPLSQQGQLAELLRTASSDGYAIRVAVIASRADLGSVTELWREPQTYARFLGLEVALVYRGPLLVVMPDGLGLSGLPASAATAVAGVHPSAGSGLGDAALTAIQRLARAAGHLLPVPPPAAVDTGPHGSDAIAVLAFAFGAALILIAWTASLRARPPRLPGRRAA